MTCEEPAVGETPLRQPGATEAGAADVGGEATARTAATTRTTRTSSAWPAPQRVPDGELITALWWCPVCRAACHRRHRPGRAKVYCSHACRQRAYRWRRLHLRRPPGKRRPVAPATTERARTRDTTHARRSADDVLVGGRDSAARVVTACGTFARAAIDAPERHWHTAFLPTGGATGGHGCRSCQRLLGLPDVDLAPVVAMATARLPFRLGRVGFDVA